MVNVWGASCRSLYQSPQWEGNRPVTDQSPIDNSPLTAEPARDSPPSTVARALREQCHIDYEGFFLAVTLKNGQVACFSGPDPLTDEQIRGMFRRDRFLQYQHGIMRRDDGVFNETARGGYSEGYGDGRLEDHWVPTSRRRRRQRGSALRRELDDDRPPVVAAPKVPLRIGDSEALWNFYDHRFRCIQQTTCKHIGKAFVKAIAPRKQANNPYTRGDATAPGWWPKPWGPGEKDRVRHIEPDHLLKPERIHLLVHILKLVVEPLELQHPDIQKADINVAKLECITMEQLSTWFADKNTNNARKKPILQEVFKVAKMEEKYKRDELDANTIIYVMADDMVQNYCPSDDEDDDDNVGFPARLKAESERKSSGSDTSSVPPTNTATPHNLLPSLNSSHALNPTTLQAASYMGTLSIRDSQYGTTAMMPPDHYQYADGGNMTNGGQATSLQAHATALHMHDVLSGPQEPGRRSSILNTPSDFSSLSPSGMYPANVGWQPQQPQSASTAPPPSAMYAVTAQAAHHAQTPLPLPPLQQQEQQYGPQGFDPLPHSQHDLFRGSGMSQSRDVCMSY